MPTQKKKDINDLKWLELKDVIDRSTEQGLFILVEKN